MEISTHKLWEQAKQTETQIMQLLIQLQNESVDLEDEKILLKTEELLNNFMNHTFSVICAYEYYKLKKRS